MRLAIGIGAIALAIVIARVPLWMPISIPIATDWRFGSRISRGTT